jgi:hypothetical protein
MEASRVRSGQLGNAIETSINVDTVSKGTFLTTY